MQAFLSSEIWISAASNPIFNAKSDNCWVCFLRSFLVAVEKELSWRAACQEGMLVLHLGVQYSSSQLQVE